MFNPILQQGLSDQLTAAPPLAFVAVFGAGLVTSLTPCVYPMIPIAAGIIASAAGKESSRVRTVTLTLTYAAGLALLYATMGLIAGVTGTLFGTIAANPWVRFAMGNLLILFGLAMLGVFPLTVPNRMLQWTANLGSGTYPAVFVLGAASGIVAAPCGAPAFAAVLTWVSTTGSAILGFLYLLVFSLGMTALLIVVGFSSGSLARLPKSGPWMIGIKKASGIVMLGMAEYYFIQMGLGL
jgi:cytochrome c-type biogenesis protein